MEYGVCRLGFGEGLLRMRALWLQRDYGEPKIHRMDMAYTVRGEVAAVWALVDVLIPTVGRTLEYFEVGIILEMPQQLMTKEFETVCGPMSHYNPSRLSSQRRYTNMRSFSSKLRRHDKLGVSS